MKNTRMMYVRPGNLFKDFIIEQNRQVVTSTGRVANCHGGDGTKTLKGCLAEASDEDRTNHSQKDHVVTHTIVQGAQGQNGLISWSWESVCFTLSILTIVVPWGYPRYITRRKGRM